MIEIFDEGFLSVSTLLVLVDKKHKIANFFPIKNYMLYYNRWRTFQSN